MIRLEPAGISWLARGWERPPILTPRAAIPYDIPLRLRPARGDWARLILPADLTHAEAERLCGVIRATAM